MGAFVVEYEGLRWGVTAAFAVTAVLVAARLVAAPAVENDGGTPVFVSPMDRESDAAHLLMCLVMLAMLMFPAAPAAVQGVLTAMVVVYGVLLAGRVLQRRAAAPGAMVPPVAPLVYHVIAAAAMLWAMSGHAHGAHHSAPQLPMFLLAVLFTVDAVLLLSPGTRNPLPHVFPHHAGPAAVVPHLVMDLGTAYMLVAAALG
ncbi:DUF5134 domain-containing protein [Nocardia blacklockiae]|uniref:DUF5134 domain-containing protein n=1 Tax=Nocardia blacklockiae TaxID=480036 RepID=UPI0018948243|nr:DUF5134 domain-containing protein [Nocardia blacklockiae]MBF6176755.1 DUF5134 domain-containing protein [Nocardia blacklockiae]